MTVNDFGASSSLGHVAILTLLLHGQKKIKAELFDPIPPRFSQFELRPNEVGVRHAERAAGPRAARNEEQHGCE